MDSPAQSANVFGNDNIVVQAVDSVVNIAVGAKPYLRLTQYERRTRLAALDNSETALLSAYREDVVDLIGRDGELADLRTWLDTEARVSVHVIVGAGGRGKTRLALELARRVSKDWLAGFLTAEELDRFRSQYGVEQWRWDKPVLIIIDYAASRADQLRAWLRELIDASLEDRPKLRLLLLERQANRAIGWLATVFGQGDNDDSRAAIARLDPKEPIELPALEDLEFRRQVFGALLTRANGALAAPAKGADLEFERRLGDRKWAGDPLYLMIAGLAAARTGVQEALSLSRPELALSVARNELDRIGRLGVARGIDDKAADPGAFLRHMAVIATLTQGLSRGQARELAAQERARLQGSASLDATVQALADALPAEPDGAAPILPDVIGEGAILAWLGIKGGLAASGADPLPSVASAARLSRRKVSETLVRTAQDFAASGYAEPVEWLEALTSAPEIDLGALLEIAESTPPRTLALTELGAKLYERIAETLRGPAAAEAEAKTGTGAQAAYSASLNKLAARLSNLGRRGEALAAAQASTKVRRRLATDQPDEFLPDLAESLHNLGLVLSGVGQHEEALVASQQATSIYRPLAAIRPADFLANLSSSLVNESSLYGSLGRRDAALAVGQEAVDIRRRLSADQPVTFLPGLAIALHGLGNALSAVGRRADAIAAIQEGNAIYRRLSTERPDAFLVDFAKSLQSFGSALSDLGRLEEALAASDEAVQIRRGLAGKQPAVFLPDLAASLHNHASDLSALGRHAEALSAASETVKINRRLAEEQPDVFLSDLAGSLQNFSGRASESGQREDALAACVEAVEIYDRLAAENAEAFLPKLASAVHDLGACFAELGHHARALAAAQEATRLYRGLSGNHPGAFADRLARSLQHLGNALSQSGEHEQALAVTQEAVGILRDLAEREPQAFLPTMASLLNNLGNRFRDLGRNDEAVATAREGVEIRRRLAAVLPDAYLPSLALSLRNLGGLLADIHRNDEALAPAQEAVQAFRPLAAAQPGVSGLNLGIALGNLSAILTGLGRRDEALAAANEGIRILVPFFLQLPAAYAQIMIASAQQYVKSCKDMGVSPDEAMLGPIAAAFKSLQRQ
jgi:hypothetical protein